jgi:hypothetical protein
VQLGVVRGELQIGYLDTAANLVPATYVLRPLERFGSPFNPVIYVRNSATMTLVNRFVDDDVPIAASAPAWFQRGVITPNSDWFQGGTGGHHGAALRPYILDTLYSHQNLSVG